MIVMAICAAGLCVLILGWTTGHLCARREVLEKSVEPEELLELLSANLVLLYDVRQPLDFLAYPETIPGAMRIAPRDIAEVTASFSRDQESVIYCTGGDHQTSRMVLRKARALNFTQVKILRGGLGAWKDRGYPVEAYTRPFQLDTVA
jgi:rhodanese-related sulfurtransferase